MSLLGVVAALPDEAACLSGDKLRPGQRLRIGDTVIQVSGMGEAAAKRAASELAEQGADALASWGTAGALDPLLQSGDLLLPEEVRGTGATFPVDEAWRARLATLLDAELTVRAGLLLHSSTAVESPAAKHELHRRTGALAVDMESAAIAAVAASRGLPVLIVRSIADTAESFLPRAALSAVDAYGRARFPALLRALCARPREIAQLIRLARAFRCALASLRRTAAIAGPTLGRSPRPAAE